MEYRIGDILTGKVTGVQPYGAFVMLDEHTQGLVHISECQHGYVKDTSDIFNVGQRVEVVIWTSTNIPKKLVYPCVRCKRRLG